jgi:hypothetical protein
MAKLKRMLDQLKTGIEAHHLCRPRARLGYFPKMDEFFRKPCTLPNFLMV